MLLTLIFALPSMAYEAFEYTYEGVKIEYAKTGNGTCSAEYPVVHKTKKVIIPEYAYDENGNSYLVTGITNCAGYSWWDGLEEISIPTSVESIGLYVFSNVRRLKSITAPWTALTYFYNARSSLQSIILLTIPEEVDKHTISFENWYHLEYVRIPSGCKRWTQNIFWRDSTGGTPIDVDFESIDDLLNIQFYSSSIAWYYGNLLIDGELLTSLDVPSTITTIYPNALYKCKSLTSVTLPESIESIGEYAFSGCSSLESVTLPEGLEGIKEYTFNWCSSLKSINIPESVKSIGEYAFSDCSSLESFTLPEDIEGIREKTFNGCSSLKSINIPESVKSIGDYAFSGCSSLKSVTIPESLETLGYKAYNGCTAITSLTVPIKWSNFFASVGENNNGLSLTLTGEDNKIGNSAFSGWKALKSVSIPASVIEIEEDAFKDCINLDKAEYASLESLCGINFHNLSSNPLNNGHHLFIAGEEIKNLVCPSNLASIGQFCFYGASGLETVVIPASVTTIGEQAFGGCSALESVVIPSSVTTIGQQAFYGCSELESVVIPSSVTTIGEKAFGGCSGITDIDIQSTSISQYSLGWFDVTDTALLRLPAGTFKSYVLLGGWDVFTNIVCGDVSYLLTDAVASSIKYRLIDYNDSEGPQRDAMVIAGDYSSLTSAHIPNREVIDGNRYTIKYIRSSAFENCNNLSSVTFDSRIDLEWIGASAFKGCTSLSNIELPESVNEIFDSAFEGCTSLESISLPKNITRICPSVFFGCTSLSEVILPSDLYSIENSAFRGCTNLSQIDIPEKVKTIGAYAFHSCSSLKEINLLHVDNLGVGAFMYSGLKGTGLDKYEFDNSLMSGHQYYNTSLKIIPKVCYYGCSSLTSLIIPRSVMSIEDNAFGNCTKLNEIIFQASSYELSLGDIFSGSSPTLEFLSIFRDISQNPGFKTKELKIGNCVTTCPSFKGQSGLKTIALGSGITEIPNEAFKDCGLSEVVIPVSVTTIGESAFANNANLKTVSMGCNVVSIGDYAFDNCPITNVYLANSSDPTAAGNVFSTYNDATLWIPEGMEDYYYDESLNCWYRFGDFKNLIAPTSFETTSVDSFTGAIGDSVKLSVSLMPANVTLPYIFWESTNPEVAVVDLDGVVTIVGPASATPTKIKAWTLYDFEPIEFEVTSTGEIFVQKVYDSNTINGDACNNGIYTLQGVCLNPNATEEAVKNLQPGMYIIRGKKVVIK